PAARTAIPRPGTTDGNRRHAARPLAARCPLLRRQTTLTVVFAPGGQEPGLRGAGAAHGAVPPGVAGAAPESVAAAVGRAVPQGRGIVRGAGPTDAGDRVQRPATGACQRLAHRVLAR